MRDELLPIPNSSVKFEFSKRREKKERRRKNTRRLYNDVPRDLRVVRYAVTTDECLDQDQDDDNRQETGPHNSRIVRRSAVYARTR